MVYLMVLSLGIGDALRFKELGQAREAAVSLSPYPEEESAGTV